jgi:hypothetical protein
MDSSVSSGSTVDLLDASNMTSESRAATGSGSIGSFSYTGSPLVNTVKALHPSAAISSDYFGMTIHHSATPFPAFPISTLRFWDVVNWRDIEPSRGQFVWTRTDSTIATARKKGINDFVFAFGAVPLWAATNPSEPCPGGGVPGYCSPPDITALDELVTHVVQRYCGAIRYYETWNEPNGSGYWKGSNTQLLTIAQHLYRIARDPANCGCANGVCTPNGGANPNKVLLPTISRITQPNLNWLDSYLGAAGSRYPYADIAAFHGYTYTANPEEIVTQVQLLNQVLAKHGLGNLPLWNTEASWNARVQTNQQRASWLMRYYMAQAVAGVSRFIWYAFDDCGTGTLWEAPWCKDPQTPVGQLTDAGRAYGVIENWLAGANVTGCQQYQNGLWACELQRAGNYDAWMLWSTTDTDISVPIPTNSGLTVYRDWQNKMSSLPAGITVNQMPVLLESGDPSNRQQQTKPRK